MNHTEKYLQAKWVTENPKGYDERDVERANSYCEAYLEGYKQALSIANVSESFSKADLLDLGGWFDGSPEFVEEVVNDWLNAR